MTLLLRRKYTITDLDISIGKLMKEFHGLVHIVNAYSKKAVKFFC